MGSTSPVNGTNANAGWEKIAKLVSARINDAIPKSYHVDSALIPPNLDESVLQLPKTSGILTARELEITELTAVKLLSKIWSRVYTSVEVARAFCKRAAIAHQVTNCIAHVMFDDALRRAAELDKYLEETGNPIGPLHGLPISVKEHIYFKDTPATAGFIAWANDFSPEDALIIKVLREAGAVFHVKTTNPQGLMALETVSNIYGRTTNPWNRFLTPGGSSGGEGAIVAMRGSLIGIGTDMGGSIRGPAAFSGVFGLKPSVARNPHSGLAGMSAGMENIIGVVGPLATCVEDIRLFQEVVLANAPWRFEPSLIRMPWNSSIDGLVPKKLKIGVIWDDGVVQPHPPVARALMTASKQLSAAGHQCIDWNTALHKEIQETVIQMYFLDAGDEFWRTFDIGHEPPVEIIRFALGQAPSRSYTVEETWQLNIRRNEQQTKYAGQWNETGIDFILAPANQAAAPAHDEAHYNGYTEVWNGLDYSAITFPVSTVRESDTYENYPRRSEEPLNTRDAYFIDAYKTGPRKYRNAPVALQIIGRRHEEEKILRLTELVTGILGSS